MRKSPWVAPTASSDERLLLGMSPGGVDDLGRTIAPNPLLGYQVTDPSAVDQKKTIVLMSGVHPNETLANHVLEALLDWLVGDSAHAAGAAQQSTVHDLPDGQSRRAVCRVQPDHRATRRPRCQPFLAREDLWHDMPDIATVGQALIHDTSGSSVDIFIDLHCWTDTRYHVGILCKEEGYWDDSFWRAMVALEPGLATWDSGWDNPSTETFAFERLSAGFCMTFELMYLPGEELVNLRRVGRHLGEALYRTLAADSVDP